MSFIEDINKAFLRVFVRDAMKRVLDPPPPFQVCKRHPSDGHLFCQECAKEVLRDFEARSG